MHQSKRALALGLIVGLLVFAGLLISSVSAASKPSLGTAASFAVLGGQTVTNTGPSVITGNLGVSPGSAVTGFPPGTVVGGSIHTADAVALQAQSDVTTAYNNLTSQPCSADLTGKDLGGLTLTAGVYCFTSSAQLTGTLTLDAQGNPDAVFIFKIASKLTAATGSTVRLINGGSPCNVFWQVGSSATLNTTTTFLGNILALTSIALKTDASLDGRALARNGSVTLDSNTVGPTGCAAPPTPTATSTATSAAATSTPVATSTTVPTSTPVPTVAATATNTPAPYATHTPVATATATAVPPTATSTPYATSTPHATATPHATRTPVPTATPAPCNCEVLMTGFLDEQYRTGKIGKAESTRLLVAYREYLQDNPCVEPA